MSLVRGSGGGGGFTLGPIQNVFSGSTKAAAQSARDAYAAANPNWIQEYNNDLSLNIRLEYLESGNLPAATYQVRNGAGNGWLDNSSSVGLVGPQGDEGPAGAIDTTGLTPNTVPIVNQAGDNLVDSGIFENSENILVNKTLIVPQESILIGPAVKISDKGGFLGVSNIAEDSRGFGVISKTYETEAQRDLDFPDGVPRIDYQYLVPAKWVYQFPFEDITSDDNLLSFEFEDSDNTFIRKLRLFSTTALSGVRVWIENILPSGDALVWENVSPENQAKGQGLTLSDTGFSELETGFIKISTANIKFRFSIQAMTGEKLNLIGSSLDLGFGTGFYPKMYTYTQDSIKTELLDGIDTAHNRFGEFKDSLRLDADKVVVRKRQNASDTVLQSDFSVLVDNDRPDIVQTNGNQPIVINSITVKHQGTWGPVQVSFSDLRTKVVNLVDGDNTITLDGKPLVIEANEDYYIRFTGAVGTGSQSQISLLGNSSGKPYASINTTRIKEKNLSDGSQDVVELDVSSDSSVTLDSSYVGKFVNIIQTGTTAAIPMLITLASHDSFAEGDVIHISTDETYVNYYFAVYYTDKDGRQLVSYPAKNSTLTRTSNSWDVSKDGTYTNTIIHPTVGTVDASEDNPLTTPVKGFLFIEHPAVAHFENQDGTTSMSIDLNQVDSGQFLVDGNDTSDLIIGGGINYAYDAVSKESTISIDPTNINLDGFAELETDVIFSKLSIENSTNPAYVSVLNVTNGGNSELNLVGTSNIRKVDKVTGDTTDVININGTSGALDIRTDTTYQGSVNSDKSIITREYLEGFGRGLGVPKAINVSGGNSYTQTAAVALFATTGADINDILIQLDADLLESETIVSVPYDSQVTTKNFDIQQNAGQGTTKNIRSGDSWRVRMIVDQSGANQWFWEKVYSEGGNVVYGLTGRNDIIDEVSVKAFAFAEGMPYHLLLETPVSSRLIHEFPKNKTFRFTPTETGRLFEDSVVVNQANQSVATGDLSLGEWSDFPLYVIEPNVVINRDQRAWVNFPANMTIDTSNGFYCFGTVSGWCGNSQTEGNVAAYVGNSENFRSYTGAIGVVLGNSGVFLMDGQNLRTPNNSASFGFNIESGVAHMIRYAFYVAPDGMMTYYIVDLNSGQLSSGTRQCTLSSIGVNPKMYVSYDRYGNNTSAIAIAETHIVLNSGSSAEQRWDWRF